jgi:hypothetical protein
MRERQMAVVGKKTTFSEAEDEDIFFWADQPWTTRLQESGRMRKKIWTFLLGEYPTKMQMTGSFIKWSSIEK